MTQQEKDKLHIKKQNRRYQKLILGISDPNCSVAYYRDNGVLCYAFRAHYSHLRGLPLGGRAKQMARTLHN